MQSSLQPAADRILVEPLQEDKVSKGGVILPDQAMEKPHRGIIIAVGPEVGLHDAEVRAARETAGLSVPTTKPLEAGDEILYSKYGGTELKVDLREVVLLRETDVFGIVVELDTPADEE